MLGWRCGARAPPLLRALSGGAPLALLVIALYYFERVEGVRSLRPLFALLLVLGYAWRVLRLSSAARAYALAIRPSLPLPAQEPRAIDVLQHRGRRWGWALGVALAAVAARAALAVGGCCGASAARATRRDRAVLARALALRTRTRLLGVRAGASMTPPGCAACS